jgi:predicted  nucleic acid-binding Zn-ribbon protein
MVWMAKDAGSKDEQLINQSKEPEVVKAVLAEINKMGDGFVGIKKNYDELRHEHEQLKGLLDRYESRMDTLTKQEVQKYTEAISVRQDALDASISKANDRSDQITKDVTKRLDDIELAGGRRYTGNDLTMEGPLMAA